VCYLKLCDWQGFFGREELAPPEVVLQKNTLPGSCWPMSNGSGQVTFKLPYPVVVEEVSIDHASVDILPPGWEYSAPKVIKVIGYPPCDEADEECLSLGFDKKDPMEISQFTYNIAEAMVQTFDSHYGKAMNEIASASPKDDKVLKGSSDDNQASCSEEAASCSAPPRISVAGVTLKVLENWGNPEFTCLYRVRIHGEPDY
jgi:SUN domain-containing protein 1/2